jgi:hypothetical protein
MPHKNPGNVQKALMKTRGLLAMKTDCVSDKAVHEVKSILYAAIEESRREVEYMSHLNRSLRELFSLVSMSMAGRPHEKQLGLEIIDDLLKKLTYPFQSYGLQVKLT